MRPRDCATAGHQRDRRTRRARRRPLRRSDSPAPPASSRRPLRGRCARDAGTSPTRRRAAVCHWHFTDRLFGDDRRRRPPVASSTLTDRVARPPRRHVSTTCPPPRTLDTRRRRVAAYRAVAAPPTPSSWQAGTSAAGSPRRHRRGHVIVIPLPVSSPRVVAGTRRSGPSTPAIHRGSRLHLPRQGPRRRDRRDSRAAGRRRRRRARPGSDGHEDLARHLRLAAAAAGRTFRSTGFLGDARPGAGRWRPSTSRRRRPRRVGVGVARHVAGGPADGRSSSPTTTSTSWPRWTRGCSSRYEPDDLASAIGGALDDPASTWRNGPPSRRADASDRRRAPHRALYRGTVQRLERPNGRRHLVPDNRWDLIAGRVGDARPEAA